MYSGGFISISSSTFSSNNANRNGEGLYSVGAGYISSSSIDANSAQYGEGVFFASFGSSVADSTFRNNIATISGAGIYGAGSTIIASSIFSFNKANVNGGGLYIVGNLIMSSNTLCNANLRLMGAIFVSGLSSSISDSEFNDNVAMASAGAIYSSNSITISSSSFSNNKVNSNGGAIYSTGATIINSTTIFDSNNASNGGVVFITRICSIIETEFANNIGIGSGGALYSSNNLNIFDSSFISNKAKYRGAIYSSENTVLFMTITVFDCSAIEGGAIYKYGGILEINDSTFLYNIANSGGALFKTKNKLILNDVEFYENIVNTSINIEILDGISYGGITKVFVIYEGGNNVLDAIWNNDNASGNGNSINGDSDSVIVDSNYISSEGSRGDQYIDLVINGEIYGGITNENSIAIFEIVFYPNSTNWIDYEFHSEDLSSGAISSLLVKSRLISNISSKETYNTVTKIPCPILNKIYNKVLYLKTSKGVFKQVIKNGNKVWIKESAKIVSKNVNGKTIYYITIGKKHYILNKTQNNPSIIVNNTIRKATEFSRMVPMMESCIISYSLSSRKWFYNYNSANLKLKVDMGSKNITGNNNVFYYIFNKIKYILKVNKKYFNSKTHYYTGTVPVYAKYAKNIKHYVNTSVKYITSTILHSNINSLDGMTSNITATKQSVFTNNVLISSKIEPILN